MTKPLITIAIPTFQGAPYLGECLESALRQTALTQCEILICDDGSTDGTVDLARAIAAEHPQVRVEQNPERLGLVGNWNRTVERAQGNWIKFLFQDDTLAPECVATMLEAASGQPALVVCDRNFAFAPETPTATREYFLGLPGLGDACPDDSGFEHRGSGDPGPGDPGSGKAVSGDTHPGSRLVPTDRVCAALLENPGANVFGEPPTILVHRQLISRFGGFRDALIQLCDLEFVARLGCNAGLIHVRQPLATFRVHGESASASNKAGRQFRKDVLDTLILYHEFAFAGQFAPLRAAARSRGVSLGARAAKELHRAERDAKAAEASGDTSLHQELDAVRQAHPALANGVWSGWHRVRKQFRKP